MRSGPENEQELIQRAYQLSSALRGRPDLLRSSPFHRTTLDEFLTAYAKRVRKPDRVQSEARAGENQGL